MKKVNEILSRELEKIPEVMFGYLFGSYADGSFAPYSDVDVALFFDPQANTLDKRLAVHHALSKALGKELDMLSLNSAKNLTLLKAVFEHSVLIKDSSDDARKIYEVERYHDILDYLAFKKMIDAA